jgi:uncharacterized membrane protein
MDGETLDQVVAFIAASLTIGVMWYSGIFELFDIFYAEWVKYAAALIGFFASYGLGINVNAFSRAGKEIAYEDKKASGKETQEDESALKTLKNKFAEGEISEEEFNRKKEILQEEDDRLNCPECGEEVDEDQDYCTNCGEEL